MTSIFYYQNKDHSTRSMFLVEIIHLHKIIILFVRRRAVGTVTRLLKFLTTVLYTAYLQYATRSFYLNKYKVIVNCSTSVHRMSTTHRGFALKRLTDRNCTDIELNVSNSAKILLLTRFSIYISYLYQSN